ncbi:helix-turn-helix domain-containing protein, partial [Cetobacterium sp.]|uniref:helix-turn-helix domain-containing protein n=1 Tax=Cetobacterium sp. TaxID=2071632 RepID=UPI003EE7F72D
MNNRRIRVGIKVAREEVRRNRKIVTCPLDRVTTNFTQITNYAITLLDSEALHIYLYLLMRCMGGVSCYPSRDLISKETGVNKNKLTDIFNHLKKLGLLRVELRRSGSGYN